MPNRSCEYESSAAHYEGGHLSAILMLPFTQPRSMNEAFWALRVPQRVKSIGRYLSNVWFIPTHW
jgi:hypothetical protein